MNTQLHDFDAADDQRIVYVRPVKTRELPEDVRAHAGESEEVYALHAANGDRIALVRDREMAFVLARQNDLSPVNVH